MCMVSVIGDVYKDKWHIPWSYTTPEVSRHEFESLRREVESLKELLKAAKKFDEQTGQPDCEMGDKVELIRKVAKAVGVNLDDVLKPNTS